MSSGLPLAGGGVWGSVKLYSPNAAEAPAPSQRMLV